MAYLPSYSGQSSDSDSSGSTSGDSTVTVQPPPSPNDIAEAGRKLSFALGDMLRLFRQFWKNSAPLLLFHFFTAIAYACTHAYADKTTADS